ncbi:DNA-deoxyinosine glycosylase [Paenibacillus sp. LMG 31456]|uniref:DNA-deoxyinosine glycosylase n=1 Tax=Paenibacillus foliorum TaxID=2654974 RepID=A0A972JZP5_9BACL|nr:DNA-deoxyinosine glycosylase [Paenibacillus foliorum]NOU92063.1 DNA-deoxyinosine glycosylase [Paenibacillus foliorum]
MADQEVRLQGLPPVVNKACTTLVLGSMPGALSLSKQEYYGHPRNHFWPLLYKLYGDGASPSEDYGDRLAFVLKHKIALWDVLGTCLREGSLDADIRDPEENDFAAFFHAYPAVERVFFNGQAAEQLYRKRVLLRLQEKGLGKELSYRTFPSSSPARTMTLDAKLAFWRELDDN